MRRVPCGQVSGPGDGGEEEVAVVWRCTASEDRTNPFIRRRPTAAVPQHA